MRQRSTTCLLTSLALVGTGILSACSTQTTASPAEPAGQIQAEAATPADPSDPIVVYSGRSEVFMEPLFERFTAETGIPLNVRYGSSTSMSIQLIEEGDKTSADFYIGQDSGALGALDSAGICAPTTTAEIERIPVNYRSAQGTWVGLTGRARVLAYNSDKVAAQDVPRSIFDLTDPKWKGQVAIAPVNSSFQAFVSAMRTSQGEDVTRAWLEAMVDNDVQSYEKNSEILLAVEAGEVTIGLMNHYYWYQRAEEIGADAMKSGLVYTKPNDPGSLVNITGACVLTYAPNPEPAQQLLEWLLGDEAQQWFVDSTFEYPLASGIAGPEGVPPMEELRSPDLPLTGLTELPETLQLLMEVGLV